MQRMWKLIWGISFGLWALLAGAGWASFKLYREELQQRESSHLQTLATQDQTALQSFAQARIHEVQRLTGLSPLLEKQSQTPAARDLIQQVFKNQLQESLASGSLQRFQWIDPLQNVLLQAEIQGNHWEFQEDAPSPDLDYLRFAKAIELRQLAEDQLHATYHVRPLPLEAEANSALLAAFKVLYFYRSPAMKGIGALVMEFFVPRQIWPEFPGVQTSLIVANSDNFPKEAQSSALFWLPRPADNARLMRPLPLKLAEVPTLQVQRRPDPAQRLKAEQAWLQGLWGIGGLAAGMIFFWVALVSYAVIKSEDSEKGSVPPADPVPKPAEEAS